MRRLQASSISRILIRSLLVVGVIALATGVLHLGRGGLSISIVALLYLLPSV